MDRVHNKQPRPFQSRPDLNTSLAETRVRTHGADLATLLKGEGLASSGAEGLVVEIGCGVGLHPIQYAKQFPSKRIVAIERTSDKFEKFAGRLDNHLALKKVICAVHADAVHFIDRNFSAHSIDEVWLLYPNPETKKISRRWFRSPFIHRLLELMKPGATLHFATNLEDYANDAVQLAPALGLQCVVAETVTLKTHPDFVARTHFEKKYLQRGEPIFTFQFARANDRSTP